MSNQARAPRQMRQFGPEAADDSLEEHISSAIQLLFDSMVSGRQRGIESATQANHESVGQMMVVIKTPPWRKMKSKRSERSKRSKRSKRRIRIVSSGARPCESSVLPACRLPEGSITTGGAHTKYCSGLLRLNVRSCGIGWFNLVEYRARTR